MSFTKESVEKLADVVSPKVFEELVSDGRYLDGLHNSIESAIIQVLGRTSPALVGALSDAIINRIGITGDCNPYSEFNIWKTRYETLYSYVKKNYAESYVDGIEYDIHHPDNDLTDQQININTDLFHHPV